MGKLKDIFKKNGYPNGIFDRCLNKFLDRIFNEKHLDIIRSKEHLENNSAIFDHIKTCQNCQNSNIENFQILSTGNSDKDIRIKQALLIKRHKPCLNNQLTHKGISYFLHLF